MEEFGSPWYIDCVGLKLPSAFSPDVVRTALNYNHKPGQLFLMSYPKCGSTWMQHIITLILRKGQPLKDGEDFLLNSPILELAGVDAVESMSGPGVIKSHFPFHMIRTCPDAKYIYIARNPKDNCVSFYYHTKKFFFYNFQNGTFDQYFDLYVNGQAEYGDYFDQVLSWYEHRNDHNVHFVTYESLKKDTKAEILKLAKFIGEEYFSEMKTDPKYLENVLYYSSLDYMKDKVNEDMDISTKSSDYFITNYAKLPSGFKYYSEFMSKYAPEGGASDIKFIRKGVVGDWKNHFTPEQEERMEQWIKRKTEGSDLMNLWKDIDSVA